MWPDDDTDLPVEAHAAFGANPAGDPGDWVWTDLTGRLLDNPIPLRRGANGGSGDVSPSSGTVHLLNDDGALTPLSPSSGYYPNVALGTPIRLALRRAEDGFARTTSSGWGTADSGQQWTTSGGAGSDYSTTGGVARQSFSAVNVLRQARLGVDLLDTEQIVDVSTPALITGAALVTGVIARYVDSAQDFYWCRTEFNSGGTTVTLKISRVRAGDIVDLANLVVPGLAYAANVPLRTRISVVGDRIGMKVWTASGTEPVGWHLDTVDPDPLTAPGATGIESWLVPGNSNALPVVVSFRNYAVRVDLLNANADQWQPQFIPSTDGMHSVIRLTASGILRRLGQGNNVERSPLTRYLPSTNPIVWWPLEDGVDSTQATSGILGGQPMQVVAGIMDFTDEAPPGAAGSAHPDPGAANALIGTVSGASASEWHASIWVRADLDDDGSSGYCIPWEIRTTTGKILRLVFQSGFSEGLGVGLWDTEGQDDETFLLSIPDSGITGEWLHVTFSAQQSGGNVNVYLNIGEVQVASATWSSSTIGAPIRVNAIGAFTAELTAVSDNVSDIYLSQFTIHNGVSLVPQQQAGLGFPDELASDRVARVCVERGIPVVVEAGDSEPLGPQPAGGDLDVLRDAEQADMGILYERGWGLGYRPRSARYNQPAALTIDLATYQHAQDIRPEQVVAPTYDDQGTRNDVTASRRDGSSARVADEAHAAAHGVYDDSVDLGVATDAVLPNHASWRVHLGTWEEMRYPSIPVDLAGNPDLIDAWLNLRVGERVVQTGVPAPHPPEDVDQLAGNISQTLSRRGTWSGTVVGTPARPWTVGVLGDDVLGRLDTDGSKLVNALAAGTDTSALVTVTDGPGWITTATHAAQFPFNIKTGGVLLRVLAGGEVISGNPWFESDVAGWVATTGATIGHSTAQARSGIGSMLITPDGVSVIVGATVTQAAAATVSAGVDYLIAGWLRPSGSVSDARMAIDWYQANGTTFISSTLPTPIALSAGVWTHYSAVVTSPALAARARLRVRLAGTPTGSIWADECVLIPVGTYTGPADNFNRTVAAGSWGTATTGQAWSVGAGTASEYSVNGTVGRMALVSVNDLHVITVDTGSPDHDPIARLTLPVVPTGASITLRQYARWSDASNHYFAELSIQTDTVAMLRLYRRVATVATAIGGPVMLTPSHVAGGAWWVQCSAMGSTIRARAWLGGQPEARGWHITVTDTALTSATRAGPGARREAGNTNGSQTIDVESFGVPCLQTFTISSTPVNGVARTIPAGTALSLANPWRLAL